MKLGTKISLGLGVLTLLVALTDGIVVQRVSNQLPHLATMGDKAKITSDHADDLLSAVHEIQLDVVQVQQFLSDISATRGLDGMDDGLTKAAENAKKFDSDMQLAIGHAQALDLPKVIQSLKVVQAQFPPYYAQGQAMAKVYVEDGPKAGNQMMAKFDPQAEAMVGDSIAQGRAMAAFRAWVAANGGQAAALDDFSLLPGSARTLEVAAETSGFVHAIDSRALGILAMEMGGGRASKDDVLDLGIGIEVHANVGDKVETGQKVLTLHHNGRTGNPLPAGWLDLRPEPCPKAPWLLETI